MSKMRLRLFKKLKTKTLKKTKLMAMSNGILRVLVAIIAIPVILTASYFGGYFFLFFVLVISLISFYEFSVLARNKNMHVNIITGLLSVFFFVVNSYINFVDNYALLLLLVLELHLEIISFFRELVLKKAGRAL